MPTQRKRFCDRLPRRNPKRSKALIAAITSFGILICGLILFAAYSQKFKSQPNVSAENTNTESNDASAAKIENANDFVGNNSNTNANTVLAENETNINVPTIPAPVSPIEPAESAAKESKKQTVTAPRTTKSGRNNSDADSIVINKDESVEMGDVIIDENGIRDRKTGKSLIPSPPKPNAPNRPPPSLSPEQLQKLELFQEKLEKGKKRVVVVKTPLPLPTP